MSDMEKTVLFGAGLIALSIYAGCIFIGHQVSGAVRDTGISKVADDVHQVTGAAASIVGAVESWTRA